EYLGLDVPV
nr:Chain B, Erb-B2 carboxyl-terminal fragment [synthetic construct]